jgi:hypothetical protein
MKKIELIDHIHLSDYLLSSIRFIKLLEVLQQFEILVIPTKLTNLEDKEYPTQQGAFKLRMRDLLTKLKRKLHVRSLILTKD